MTIILRISTDVDKLLLMQLRFLILAIFIFIYCCHNRLLQGQYSLLFCFWTLQKVNTKTQQLRKIIPFNCGMKEFHSGGSSSDPLFAFARGYTYWC